MKKILWGILIFFFILIGILVFRALQFKEPNIEKLNNISFVESQEFEKIYETFLMNFSKAITFKTISYQDLNQRDTNEFKKFINFLKEKFPLVFKKLEFQTFNQYTILLKWNGKNQNLKPAVLMGHYDVVPVNEKEWEYPPFEGRIIDNYLYGRGTIDDKITVIGLLQAAEYLLNKGFEPERTIFFSFGHDEEIGGLEGAKEVVEYLEKNQIFPEFVLDEGGAITIGMIPGIQKPVATIGIAEKGYLSLKLVAKGKGGHSSIPSEKTAISDLIEALHRLSKNPFPYQLTEVQKKMFEYIGPHFSFIQKIAIANLWLFRPLVISNLAKSDSGRASLHTTMIPTILQSGLKENIIPSIAEAILNFRLLPGDSKENVINHIKNLTKDLNIEIIEMPFYSLPSPISHIEGKEGIGFIKIIQTIKTLDSNSGIAPYLVLGATDARYFTKITKNTYRFLPIYLKEEDLKAMHGKNERISLNSLKIALKFYSIFISNL